jgi:hypothetical protein
MSLIGVGSALVGEYLAGKGVDVLGKKFKTGVIERWTRRRAEQFVNTFCGLVTSDKSDDEIELYLTSIIEDEKKSEALFDAYRRVALSASPTLGPRIVALVTARIVGADRQPTAEEDKILSAAEKMTDVELIELRDWFGEHVSKLEKKGTSYYSKGADEDSAGIDYWADWGSWAAKLAGFGFIYTYVEVKTYKDWQFDEGRVIEEGDEIKQVKLRTDMYYAAEYKDLAELVTRAEGLAPTAVAK